MVVRFIILNIELSWQLMSSKVWLVHYWTEIWSFEHFTFTFVNTYSQCNVSISFQTVFYYNIVLFSWWYSNIIHISYKTIFNTNMNSTHLRHVHIIHHWCIRSWSSSLGLASIDSTLVLNTNMNCATRHANSHEIHIQKTSLPKRKQG